MAAASARRRTSVATIGYQDATPGSLIAALHAARVDLVVDVRAIAASRKPGFSKSRLAATLEAEDIDYLHLRGLGTPREGRVAAREGRLAEFRRIVHRQLASAEGRGDLDTLAGLVRSGRKVCLLCLEASPEHCHRTIVGEALGDRMPVSLTHLAVASLRPRST